MCQADVELEVVKEKAGAEEDEEDEEEDLVYADA